MRESTRELLLGLGVVVPAEAGMLLYAHAARPHLFAPELHDLAVALPWIEYGTGAALGGAMAAVAVRRVRGAQHPRSRVWWRYQARWGAAMAAAELVTPAKRNQAGKVTTPEVSPRLLDIEIHAGQADVLTAELIPGTTAADWAAAAELLARRWHAHLVRVHPPADLAHPQVRLSVLASAEAAATFALHAPVAGLPTVPAAPAAAEPAELLAAVGGGPGPEPEGGTPWDW